MTKIYLASGSQARKKLLKTFGIKFKAVPSRIKEERKAGLSYSALVKNNALKKARDVAQITKKGVIIGADTIVVQDKKIFGKPKDLKEAKSMLKALSRKPQWLYTGVAIIDVDRHKTIIDYEKTKVYMDKLTDSQIDKYFTYASPLGKAGSFDIQSKGAFFIRRIEGCFYNVVGLPMRKLYRMLRDLDIKLFNFFLVSLCLGVLVSFLSGCSTEYNIVTGKEETFYYSTEKEVQMGQSIAREVSKKYKFVDDPLVQKRVEDIGKKVVSVCDRKDIDYNFKVLDEEEVNAVSLPGGFIYVYKGLIDKLDNDDELACILAHEVAHVVARHSIKKLQAIMGYSILRILTAAVPKGAELGNAADVAFTEIILGYARDDELLADQLASRYVKLAGYNPRSMIEFLVKLQEINRRKPLEPKNYFKTHPYVPDRIRIVKQELGEKMGFDDYINIEEKKDE